jgi:hypothetical protein
MAIDDHSLRNWGMALGGGAIAVAAGIAGLGGQHRAADPATEPAGVTAPATAGPTNAGPNTAGPVTFIVRFKESHPLGAAQALAAAGRQEKAAAAAKAALASAPDLQGLCFERFTMGGVETVLRLCTLPDGAARTAASASWLAQLRASDQVEYADANVTVDAEAKPQ